MDTLSLSTQDQSIRDRFDFWNEGICEVFAKVKSTSLGNALFEGSLEHCQLDFLGLSSVRSSPVLVERNSSLISESGEGFYKFSFQLEGESIIEQDDRCAHLTAGDWACYDTTRPYKLQLPQPYRQLVLQVPHSKMNISLGHMSRLTASSNDGSQGLGNIICNLARSARQQASVLPDDSCTVIANTIVDLLSSNLQSQQSAITNHQLTQLLQLKNYIQCHLNDPNLSLQQISQHFNISSRHLHNLFHSEDETISQYIRRLRLEKCKQALMNPHNNHLTITEVALSWGFNDPSHFGRIFRQSYGLSPKDIRG